MPLTLRWVGEPDLDRVAETRLRCYATGLKELEDYRRRIRADSRPVAGDFLLADDGAESVGTATAISFTTWVRGAALPCQGVAWVGTVRTRRRTGGAGSSGIASHIMHETLRRARERGQVLTVLMPFRVSFYEHFGYGIVERRVAWTVPLAILPNGGHAGFRFAGETDRRDIAEGYQRSVQRGQCGMERSAARWKLVETMSDDGFEVIDRPDPTGPVLGQLDYTQYKQDAKDCLRVHSHFAEDPAAFARQLHFLASLRDQYHAATLTLPENVPLNWLLKERQLPHRDVNHPAVVAKPYTRMQARILDHARLLQAMHWPAEAHGEAVIAVHETEGHISKFRVTVEAGRAAVSATDATPSVECSDKIWAAVALGDLPASQALRWGLMEVREQRAMAVLEAFAMGPPPFCEEYF